MDGKSQGTLVSAELVAAKREAYSLAVGLLEKLDEVTCGLFELERKIHSTLLTDRTPFEGRYTVRFHDISGNSEVAMRCDNLGQAIGFSNGWNQEHDDHLFAVVHFEGESEVGQ